MENDQTSKHSVDFYKTEMEKAVQTKKKKRRNTLLTVLSVLLLFVIVAVIFYRPMNGENLDLGDGKMEVTVEYMSQTSTDIISETYEFNSSDEVGKAIRFAISNTTYHRTLESLLSNRQTNHLNNNIEYVLITSDDTCLWIQPQFGIIDYSNAQASRVYKLGYCGKKEEIQLSSDILSTIWAYDCEPISETP